MISDMAPYRRAFANTIFLLRTVGDGNEISLTEDVNVAEDVIVNCDVLFDFTFNGERQLPSCEQSRWHDAGVHGVTPYVNRHVYDNECALSDRLPANAGSGTPPRPRAAVRDIDADGAART